MAGSGDLDRLFRLVNPEFKIEFGSNILAIDTTSFVLSLPMIIPILQS